MSIMMNRILGAAALGALLGAGCMQGAVQAHFHLPVTAHWGQSVLAPGDYKIKIMDLSAGPNQVVIEGQGKTIYQMVKMTDLDPLAHKSSLQLVERNGQYFVQSYRSGDVGKIFSFSVPKGTSTVTAAVESGK